MALVNLRTQGAAAVRWHGSQEAQPWVLHPSQPMGVVRAGEKGAGCVTKSTVQLAWFQVACRSVLGLGAVPHLESREEPPLGPSTHMDESSQASH